MTTTKTQILGAAFAMATTLSLLAAVHGYAAGIQRSAPREVIEMETVTVVGQLPRHVAAKPMPHVGEI